MAEAEGGSPLLLPPPPPPPRMAEVEAPTAAETDMKQYHGSGGVAMDVERSRFPYCVVWTPIPVLTWFFPIIGHMGICTSTGVIRDFAGPYFVSEDNMAFGKPAKYWKLDPAQVYASGPNAWDTAVHDASEEYKHRMVGGPGRHQHSPGRDQGGNSLAARPDQPFRCLQHNLCCDNCHSHVALALNLMRYNNSTNWNMVTLCFFCLLYGKYVSVGAFVKTWLPFTLLLGILLTVSLLFNLR
ncbi:transmembrane protein 222 isoform X1 [Trachypithecus francoisi]|uniref:transmembrane protein 222 isoform X1 n=1 Tax=Trachypithecus francoisi TaxID=54180 RepID=UPI00141BBE59|nr:transmembrane protein 222 isoform X1 [Trachypithecus francoisi]